MLDLLHKSAKRTAVSGWPKQWLYRTSLIALLVYLSAVVACMLIPDCETVSANGTVSYFQSVSYSVMIAVILVLVEFSIV